MVDLPEPKRPEYSPAAQSARQWNLIMAFLWLTAGYAALHKGIVPLILKMTALAKSPYAQLDLWFVHPLFLALILAKEGKLSQASSLLAGAGIVHGALEVWAVAESSGLGWLAFSRLLTAVPFALVCISFLSGPFPGKHPRGAWLGACLVAAVPLVRLLEGIYEL